ncbi:hypothetical protein N7447_011190 [Penicillium robsamsonii]|uniref:uncharacterized protein n=1 Tax=Penicillium robsamsonii TaxID=1792511 RepID=UPI002546A6CB|nr:uncharacterized protein N7447_011190 [Penicillium robsamsonii]KAJ5807278.1 hypothetical protein N7447_011190 [Penicillium robsamsonii]
MSRRRRPRPGPLPPRGQSCYIGAAVEGLSLLASGAEESPSAVPPPKVSPPSPSAGKACPFEPPFETRGKAVSQLASIPSSHMQPPRGRGILPRLPSVEFPPGPARGQTPSQLANIYPRQIAGLKASVAPRAHHVAGVPPPCQPPPLESAGSKPSSPPSGARRHPPSTWSACHSFAPMAVEPTG